MSTISNDRSALDSVGVAPRADLAGRRVPELYAPPKPAGPIDLHLDANEGAFAGVDLAAIAARVGRDGARRYPSAVTLEQAIGERLGVPASGVVVTAGGDEAIDRACRAFLRPGAELILPTPTFEMIGKFAGLAGAAVVSPAWPAGEYPTDAVLRSVNERTAMIAVVTPNNPTGAVATARDLERLSAAAPRAVLLVDLAYTEFADEDLTGAALALPNAIVIRSFSKAFGLAGLRVGYAAGPEPLIRTMRATGVPFPAGAFSLAAALEVWTRREHAVTQTVETIQRERIHLARVLREVGARPLESQANFVLAEFDDAEWVWRALAGVGIAVRRFGSGSGLERMLRITCPGDGTAFERLCGGLFAALRPEALLFDLDGVLADVSRSYRRAIAMTVESFGVRVSSAEIATAKREPDSNNDWVVTRRLLARAGIEASLDEVTDRFERLYQGTLDEPGLERQERLIPSLDMLQRLSLRVKLGIVTGRPRGDAERFLRRQGVGDLFGAVVCMEDGPRKPDPAPVRLAMQRLGVEAAWMVGDTPDDVVAARSAGAVPLGIAAPRDAGAGRGLIAAGAAVVLRGLSELEGMLP
jgi:histidinol-phosphate aminotransferase